MSHQAKLAPDEERAIIEQLAKQPDGFRVLYRHYLPRVFAYVAYRVGSKPEAEDLTADIFLKVVRAIDQFDHRGDGAFTTWLFRIAYTTVQQHYRTAARRPTLTLDQLPDIQSDAAGPDEVVLRKEQFAQLRSALEILPPRRKEVIILRFFGGLRNQEIATVLQLDERTVASHLSRGLEDLKRALTEERSPHE